MKPFKFLFISLALFSFNVLTSQVPTVKWWFDTKSFSAGMAAADDLDGDGKLEIVFGCYRNDGGVYALNAENGSVLWSYFPHTPADEGCNDVAPLIYDVNSDGLLEVIIASSCTPKTTCLNGKTGEVIWQANTMGSDSPPTIADLDGDGKLEILHGEFLGWVRCLSAEKGTLLWDLQVNRNSWVQTAPTIVDVNNDGQLDFVVGTWNFDNKDSLYAFNGKTRERLWTLPIHGHIYHGTSVADFDNDKKPELIVGSYNSNLYCINGDDGSIDWTYQGPGAVSCPAVIGDIDNDGECEVILTSWYKTIALTNTGLVKWEYEMPSSSYNFRGTVLADINGDAFLDVIFGTYAGEFIALNGSNGSEIFNMDIATHYGKSPFDINHAPLISDFDDDGTLDAFFVGGWGVASPTIKNNYGRAYMVSVGIGNGPDWLMFQHDIRRQSSMCYDYTTSLNDNSPDIEQELNLVYPNPATDFIIIPNKSQEIEIFSSLGSSSWKLSNIAEDRVDVSFFANGLYFIKIGNKINKFIILR
ncbi:MAG: VCBS repeat-containing protein [Saprospiraceae bacterium]|nr:VCBS repeat-containing protein [Candidatus Vicinibacter affinis]